MDEVAEQRAVREGAREAGPIFSAFRTRVERASIVHFSGELDVSSAPAARAVLSAVAHAEPALAIVDLAGLTFADTTLVSVLSLASRQTLDRGGELRLAAVPPTVRRLLSLTRLERSFPMFDSVEEALNEPGD